jgi:peptidoglycan-associated lipoprotein
MNIAEAALMLTAFVVCASSSVAQSSTANEKLARPELALTYSYVRSNAPPGGCTCFNLNGGSATFAWPIARGQFALAADLMAAHGGGISSNGYDLNLSSYTGGVRYTPRLAAMPVQPFGQVLIGLAHSSGSLVQGSGAPVANSSAAFASNLGGGLDLKASHRMWIRLFEADYLLTTFDNGSNNHQNNLRISAGAVIRF